MIQNDTELKGTQQRIAYFQQVLTQIRVTEKPANFAAMASGYRAEIEGMQAEVMDYLTHHVSERATQQPALTS